MARSQIKHIRISPEFREIMNSIKAKYLLAGKKPPSHTTITRAIAKKIKREDLLGDEFIKF